MTTTVKKFQPTAVGPADVEVESPFDELISFMEADGLSNIESDEERFKLLHAIMKYYAAYFKLFSIHLTNRNVDLATTETVYRDDLKRLYVKVGDNRHLIVNATYAKNEVTNALQITLWYVDAMSTDLGSINKIQKLKTTSMLYKPGETRLYEARQGSLSLLQLVNSDQETQIATNNYTSAYMFTDATGTAITPFVMDRREERVRWVFDQLNGLIIKHPKNFIDSSLLLKPALLTTSLLRQTISFDKYGLPKLFMWQVKEKLVAARKSTVILDQFMASDLIVRNTVVEYVVLMGILKLNVDEIEPTLRDLMTPDYGENPTDFYVHDKLLENVILRSLPMRKRDDSISWLKHIFEVIPYPELTYILAWALQQNADLIDESELDPDKKAYPEATKEFVFDKLLTQLNDALDGKVTRYENEDKRIVTLMFLELASVRTIAITEGYLEESDDGEEEEGSAAEPSSDDVAQVGSIEEDEPITNDDSTIDRLDEERSDDLTQLENIEYHYNVNNWSADAFATMTNAIMTTPNFIIQSKADYTKFVAMLQVLQGSKVFAADYELLKGVDLLAVMAPTFKRVWLDPLYRLVSNVGVVSSESNTLAIYLDYLKRQHYTIASSIQARSSLIMAEEQPMKEEVEAEVEEEEEKEEEEEIDADELDDEYEENPLIPDSNIESSYVPVFSENFDLLNTSSLEGNTIHNMFLFLRVLNQNNEVFKLGPEARKGELQTKLVRIESNVRYHHFRLFEDLYYTPDVAHRLFNQRQGKLNHHIMKRYHTMHMKTKQRTKTTSTIVDALAFSDGHDYYWIVNAYYVFDQATDAWRIRVVWCSEKLNAIDPEELNAESIFEAIKSSKRRVELKPLHFKTTDLNNDETSYSMLYYINEQLLMNYRLTHTEQEGLASSKAWTVPNLITALVADKSSNAMELDMCFKAMHYNNTSVDTIFYNITKEDERVNKVLTLPIQSSIRRLMLGDASLDGVFLVPCGIPIAMSLFMHTRVDTGQSFPAQHLPRITLTSTGLDIANTLEKGPILTGFDVDLYGPIPDILELMNAPKLEEYLKKLRTPQQRENLKFIFESTTEVLKSKMESASTSDVKTYLETLDSAITEDDPNGRRFSYYMNDPVMVTCIAVFLGDRIPVMKDMNDSITVAIKETVSMIEANKKGDTMITKGRVSVLNALWNLKKPMLMRVYGKDNLKTFEKYLSDLYYTIDEDMGSLNIDATNSLSELQERKPLAVATKARKYHFITSADRFLIMHGPDKNSKTSPYVMEGLTQLVPESSSFANKEYLPYLNHHNERIYRLVVSDDKSGHTAFKLFALATAMDANFNSHYISNGNHYVLYAESTAEKFAWNSLGRRLKLEYGSHPTITFVYAPVFVLTVIGNRLSITTESDQKNAKALYWYSQCGQATKHSIELLTSIFKTLVETDARFSYLDIVSTLLVDKYTPFGDPSDKSTKNLLRHAIAISNAFVLGDHAVMEKTYERIKALASKPTENLNDWIMIALFKSVSLLHWNDSNIPVNTIRLADMNTRDTTIFEDHIARHVFLRERRTFELYKAITNGVVNIIDPQMAEIKVALDEQAAAATMFSDTRLTSAKPLDSVVFSHHQTETGQRHLSMVNDSDLQLRSSIHQQWLSEIHQEDGLTVLEALSVPSDGKGGKRKAPPPTKPKRSKNVKFTPHKNSREATPKTSKRTTPAGTKRSHSKDSHGSTTSSHSTKRSHSKDSHGSTTSSHSKKHKEMTPTEMKRSHSKDSHGSTTSSHSKKHKETTPTATKRSHSKDSHKSSESTSVTKNEKKKEKRPKSEPSTPRKTEKGTSSVSSKESDEEERGRTVTKTPKTSRGSSKSTTKKTAEEKRGRSRSKSTDTTQSMETPPKDGLSKKTSSTPPREKKRTSRSSTPGRSTPPKESEKKRRGRNSTPNQDTSSEGEEKKKKKAQRRSGSSDKPRRMPKQSQQPAAVAVVPQPITAIQPAPDVIQQQQPRPTRTSVLDLVAQERAARLDAAAQKRDIAAQDRAIELERQRQLTVERQRQADTEATLKQQQTQLEMERQHQLTVERQRQADTEATLKQQQAQLEMERQRQDLKRQELDLMERETVLKQQQQRVPPPLVDAVSVPTSQEPTEGVEEEDAPAPEEPVPPPPQEMEFIPMASMQRRGASSTATNMTFTMQSFMDELNRFRF